MKLDLALIDPNPHRDLDRNPVNPDQVASIRASIKRTGFWDNIVVRPAGDRFQMAYGHNRDAALREMGVTAADYIVKELNDYDMYVAMVDENATQKTITPAILFENVAAGIILAERLLAESETVADFNQCAKTSHGASGHHGAKSHIWREEDFTRAKDAISSGQGLGRRFLAHFLPSNATTDGHALQAALDSHYKESRAAAARAEADRLDQEADDLEEQAREDETQAAASNGRERDKERAATRAPKTKKKAAEKRKQAAQARTKADRAQNYAVDRELMERLPSPSHVNLINQAVKDCGIPAEYHEQLVDACIAKHWVARKGDSGPGTVLGEARDWWFRASGKEAQMRKEAKEEQQKRQWGKTVSLDDFSKGLLRDLDLMEKKLVDLTPFFEDIPRDRVKDSLLKRLVAVRAAAAVIIDTAEVPEALNPDTPRLEVIK